VPVVKVGKIPNTYTISIRKPTGRPNRDGRKLDRNKSSCENATWDKISHYAQW
jgi:hypothetical protein